MLNNIIQGKITLIIILSLIFSLSFTFAVLAAEVEPGDNYVLRADDITFLQAEGLVLFEGNASFKSSDFVVESNKITVDTNTKTIKALDQVVIHSDKDDLYGDSLTYNYESEKGELYGAEGSIGELNFSGKTLKILAVSPVEAEMEAAEFTPCIRKEPHYHFKAKEIKINDDNTLDIFHIVPYVWKIPVFYLPYYSVEYDPDDEESPLKNTFPVPKLGYDSDRGLTAEFKYPYQLNDKTSGEIFYLTEGREYDRYEVRRITNFYQLSDNFTIKNRYDYLYNYDLDDEELDDYEEEFFSSLKYDRGQYAIEAGVGRDLRAEDNENRYLLTGRYRFLNGLNTSFRQEYDFDWERVKERYLMNYNQHSINWNLKYIDGESYNYYPYLTLDFPSVLGVKTTLGTGRVENEGVELNKERVNLRYNFAYPLAEGISYHLGYNYRLDHYRSDYDYNYHYTSLNTGFRYKTRLNQKMKLDSSLFFEKNYPWGKSPLPDDREDQDRLIKPGLSLNFDRDLEQSSFKISSNAIYDLDLEDWDEINLRFTQNEDCYSFYLNYEFVDEAFSFGFEI
ncbi:MAG: LPS-assembly protein LptD [Bacillota bacterium]